MTQDRLTIVKYLTINERDNDWGSYVTTLGYQKVKADSPYPPQGHPKGYMFDKCKGRVLKEYQLIYITEGEGYFESSHCSNMVVAAGDMILLFPNEWHTYYPSKKTGWATYWVGFEGEYIDNLIKKDFFSIEEPVFNIHLSESITSLFIQAITTAQSEYSGYQQVLGSIAVLLLGLMRSESINKQFERNKLGSIVERARLLMKQDVDSNVSPQDIASALDVGYSWFRKLFKSYTGISPAKYQSQLRVIRAKEYLTYSAISIKEIAYQMNFESVTYFSAFFKKNTGLSPSEYINRYVVTKQLVE
ncbi:AraC family transcriptional regulator [Dysgonomonas sp. ZJ709]|uniref:helix-turn-helix domain-containing protein n=1 Tax=Dysgonomonas sp. ZJ709 TaxID=2709797 RepID=UPI0013EE337D|nr:helix-turn-helix domain-containing protein [Dysgonomonas sp. ZJ709]